VRRGVRRTFAARIRALPPPIFAEINVDIGRRNAFWIEKTLEDESELQRIDIVIPRT
jgi:hypothetical protein